MKCQKASANNIFLLIFLFEVFFSIRNYLQFEVYSLSTLNILNRRSFPRCVVVLCVIFLQRILKRGGGGSGQLDIKGDIDISGILSPNLQSNIFGWEENHDSCKLHHLLPQHALHPSQHLRQDLQTFSTQSIQHGFKET